MKIYLADTNFFLRYLLNDLPSQADTAEKYLSLARTGAIKIICPAIIIFEIDFVLEKRLKVKKDEAVTLLKPLVAANFIEVENRQVIFEALSLYLKKNIDFVDCFLIIAARKIKAEVLSFDKDFKKLSEATDS